ncbi:hypothetical protein ACFSRY_13945 [Pontibacter locisalis]|uniref:KTSC domain-containing protein n=1 Tax=Pontibacter locisalis TaxID=1719035 RepID=A0ABW5IPW9_9BACT
MNLYQFNTYSVAARLEIIWEHGSLLAYRCRRGYRIALYNLGSFFAEIWYNPENEYIALVRGFQSNKVLETYVPKIDLKRMLEEM